MGRLDTPTPLGYSSAGEILECGNAVTEVSPGDKVACIGQGLPVMLKSSPFLPI